MRCLFTILTPLIALLGIIATSIIAIINIRKAAEKTRASRTHSEMLDSLLENVVIYQKMLILLGNVAKKVIHIDYVNKDYRETSLQRYWNNINRLTVRYERVAPRLQLLLPVYLFSLSKSVLNLLNESRNIVARTNPDPYNANANTAELISKLNLANDEYFKFLEEARSYLGTDSLDKIGKQIPFTTELYNTGEVEN